MNSLETVNIYVTLILIISFPSSSIINTNATNFLYVLKYTYLSNHIRYN